MLQVFHKLVISHSSLAGFFLGILELRCKNFPQKKKYEEERVEACEACLSTGVGLGGKARDHWQRSNFCLEEWWYLGITAAIESAFVFKGKVPSKSLKVGTMAKKSKSLSIIPASTQLLHRSRAQSFLASHIGAKMTNPIRKLIVYQYVLCGTFRDLGHFNFWSPLSLKALI